MSRKNNNKGKGNSEALLDLTQLKIAKTVCILLPSELVAQNINTLLMAYYLKNKLANKKIEPSSNFIALYLGKQHNFYIYSIDDSIHHLIEEKHSYVINDETKIELKSVKDKVEDKILPRSKQTFIGLQLELGNLKDTIIHSLFHRQSLIDSGLGSLRGILISGFSGTGKSALLKKLEEIIRSEHENVNFRTISAVQLLSRVVGGAEQFIRKLFTELKSLEPAILIIQDIHLLFGRKQASAHQTTLAALLGQLDKGSQHRIITLATYNTERELTSSIRSSGKFEKEIILNLPNHTTRLNILKGFVENMNLKEEITKEELRSINLRMNGFSIGQIKLILRQAFLKYDKNMKKENIEQVLKGFRPAEIKELIVQVPEVYWNQIGGYESVKKEIKKVTQLPLKHPEIFSKFGIEPIKGIMLYGPPGCSKTMMAKAIATQSKLNFIGIKGPELFSKYVGQSERAIRNIFKRARACSPCIIFFDQIDALATQRSSNTEVSDRVLCQLLNEMDGIQGLKEVVVVAATNRPEILDKALMRPGRFDYLIYVGPPDVSARKEIFKIYLEKTLVKDDIDKLSSDLAERTEGYTGAEISLVCREAALISLEENLSCQSIKAESFDQAIKKIRKRLTKDHIFKYQQFSLTLKYD